MTARLFTFPGKRCRYYRQGRCMRDEILNPGRRQEYLCLSESALLRRWDEFIDRAEAFGLREEEARRIWEKRRSALPPARCSRAKIRLGDGGCGFFESGVCLLALPECTGACSHYSP